MVKRRPGSVRRRRAPRPRARRGQAPSHGGIVWLTGLSGAGKSTLAARLVKRLAPRRPLELLDGDEMREFLTAGLSFSRADRDTNVERIAYVARLLAKHGVLVVVAAIAPYADTRARIRQRTLDAGLGFVEVFVNASLDTVIARDVKGLYRRALAGELANFTGVSDPYEPPTDPDVELMTDRASIARCEALVLAALRSRGLA